MKKSVLLVIALCLSIALFAQKGISFQGIARDAQGNAIPNKENLVVIFKIGDNFTETQTLETDAFGVFSATIGEVEKQKFESLVFANLDEDLIVTVAGTEIYKGKFNSVPYAKAAENGVPPGCIMPFAGAATNVPAGWLLCDGTSYPTTEKKYKALYAVIGTLWGVDGSNFRVPDLRGMFLRGTNEGRKDDGYRDPEDRFVGSFQTDDNKPHLHTGETTYSGQHRHSMPFQVGYNNSTEQDYYMAAVSGMGIHDGDGDVFTTESPGFKGEHLHSLTTSYSGDKETRPKNAAVVYIIKY